MQINDQGTFYVEGEYKAGDIILTAGDWELKADVDGYKKYAFGYEPEDFPELITNGTFDTDLSGWLQPSGVWWEWDASGRAYHPSSNDYKEILQYFTSTSKVVISFDVEISSGALLPFIRDAQNANTVTLPVVKSSGEYKGVVNSISRFGFSRHGVVNMECYIDNISVKLAHPKAGDTIQLGNGHHKDFHYYPYKLSATDIQELTR